jgi:hypothetical protein
VLLIVPLLPSPTPAAAAHWHTHAIAPKPAASPIVCFCALTTGEAGREQQQQLRLG